MDYFDVVEKANHTESAQGEASKCNRRGQSPLSKLQCASILSEQFSVKSCMESVWLLRLVTVHLDASHRHSGIVLVEESARTHQTKELYFFYGSLMYPRMVQYVLSLSNLPKPKPTEIVGLRIKMWGPYPTLVNGGSGAVVRGMTYEIEGTAQKEKLANQEIEYYRTQKVFISVHGKEQKVQGTAFVWNGKSDELDEGTFDTQSWEKRTSRILDY